MQLSSMLVVCASVGLELGDVGPRAPDAERFVFEWQLARFILYDVLASIGRAVPIWGGADSLTEHWANRLGDVVVRLLGTEPAAVPAARPPAPGSRVADSRIADSRIADSRVAV